MATSSRSGRFKKKLVSLDELKNEAPLIEEKMQKFLQAFRKNEITPVEFCSIYILTILAHRYPFHFLGQKHSSQTQPHHLHFKCADLDLVPFIKSKIGHLTLGELLSSYSLRSTPQTVNRALLKWSTGEYPLVLMFRIPGPYEVLDQQTTGKRCVTVLTESKHTEKYILGERDTLSFTMHDLIHADHFYQDKEIFEGQLGFYGLLQEHKNYFLPLCSHEKFYTEFEYLIADMNAYPIHSLKCLKSAVIHHHSEGVFQQWAEGFRVRDELLKLNSSQYIPQQEDEKILNWLKEFKKI